jgi:hypothetical protein
MAEGQIYFFWYHLGKDHQKVWHVDSRDLTCFELLW